MSGEHPDWGGPYLTAAFFCLDARELPTGGALAEGIFDRYNLKPGEHEIKATFVVMASAGEARGEIALELVSIGPDGLRKRPMVFGGKYAESSTAFLFWGIKMELRRPDIGPYWFEVYLSGRFVTKVPLLVRPAITTQTRRTG